MRRWGTIWREVSKYSERGCDIAYNAFLDRPCRGDMSGQGIELSRVYGGRWTYAAWERCVLAEPGGGTERVRGSVGADGESLGDQPDDGADSCALDGVQ